jgi:hypothetical protein
MFSIHGSLLLRATALLVVLAQPALAHDLPIPGRGTFTFTLPAEWKEVRRLSPRDLPPTIELERSGSLRGSLQMTVLWSPKNAPDFTSQDKVREICLAGQVSLKGGTMEQDLPLQPLKGAQGSGFFYEATDKTYQAPAGSRPPGEYPVLTHGELGVGQLIVGFTIMSDAKADLAVREALASVQKAILQPGVDAGLPTKVQGAGIELLVDLTGFKQELGLRNFHGAYYQLGFYASKALGLNLSILVDDLGGKSLADLEKAGIGQSKGTSKLLPGEKVRSEAVDQPKGFLISYPAEFPMKGAFLAQWYFETIHQGKWLELHFSKVFRTGEDIQATHAEVARLVRTIQSVPTKP